MNSIRITPLKVGVAVLFVVALVLALSGVGYYLFFFGVQPGPSFIERLQSGQIHQQDIARLQILHFNPGGGWPFREKDYSKLQHITVTNRSNVERFLSALKSNCNLGSQPRNHPATLHWGILRVELQTGEHFYLYYTVERDITGDFASIAANSANSTNPNGATHYESTEIVSVLQSEDPWFQRR